MDDIDQFGGLIDCQFQRYVCVYVCTRTRVCVRACVCVCALCRHTCTRACANTGMLNFYIDKKTMDAKCVAYEYPMQLTARSI